MNENHNPIPCNFGSITLPKPVDPQYGTSIMQEMQFMSISSLNLAHQVFSTTTLRHIVWIKPNFFMV
jgi:hypothetical protein